VGIEPNGHRGSASSSIAHADGDATAADPETDTAAHTTTNAFSCSRANPDSDTAADGHARTDGDGDAGDRARAARTAGRREQCRHAALCR